MPESGRRSHMALGVSHITRDERGQALLEFAFLLPFVLILLLVMIDFGTAVDKRATLAQAIREAGRAGASGASAAALTDIAVTQSDGLLDADDVAVCYLDNGDSGTYPGNAGDACPRHV